MTHALILLAALAPCAAAQVVRFELAASSPSVLIGAPTEIAGRARLEPGWTLEDSLLPGSSGPFELLGAELGSPKTAPEEGIPIRLRVAAFALGPQTLPPLPWLLKGPSQSRTFMSPPVRLNVLAPAGFDPSQGLRDIRGPRPARLGPWLAGALLLAAAAAALFWLRRRSRRASAAPPAAPGALPSPEESAYGRLDALPGDLAPKEVYDAVSDILRAYLQERFAVRALSQTTLDLARALRESRLPEPLVSGSRKLLERCDLAKFARASMEKEEMLSDILEARDLVRRAAEGAREAP